MTATKSQIDNFTNAAVDAAYNMVQAHNAAVDELSREVDILRSRIAEIESQPIRRPLLTKQEAAEYLNCHVSHIGTLMGRGELHAIRFDNRPRFRAEDLDQWIDDHRE